MYEVFTRTWRRDNKDWPKGLEPHAGKRSLIARASSEEEARRKCRAYNDTHPAGRLSRKAEYDAL